MRKTKKIYKTIKALFLVFAVCFLVSTQSTAQSNLDHYVSESTINERPIVQNYTVWNFFDWIRGHLMIDNIPLLAPEEDEESTAPTDNLKRGNIVTTDMSIREGGKED